MTNFINVVISLLCLKWMSSLKEFCLEILVSNFFVQSNA